MSEEEWRELCELRDAMEAEREKFNRELDIAAENAYNFRQWTNELA